MHSFKLTIVHQKHSYMGICIISQIFMYFKFCTYHYATNTYVWFILFYYYYILLFYYNFKIALTKSKKCNSSPYIQIFFFSAQVLLNDDTTIIIISIIVHVYLLYKQDILCPKPADRFGQQLFNVQIHSGSLLLHESSTTWENQKTFPFYNCTHIFFFLKYPEWL